MHFSLIALMEIGEHDFTQSNRDILIIQQIRPFKVFQTKRSESHITIFIFREE